VIDVRTLLPTPAVGGPKVVVALVWAAATMGAAVIGPVVLALWLAPVVAAAAAQAARTWRRAGRRSRPVPQAAFTAAVVIVLAAAFGPYALLAGVLVAAVGSAAWATAIATRRAGDLASGGDVTLTLACAALPAAAAAGPVLLRAHGLVAVVVVLTYVMVYDAGSWIIGSGSRHRWTGPLAGAACIGSVTVGIAGLVSQHNGASAWELGALAAVVAPLGTATASLLLGDRRLPVPALRRLDSLVLLGPLWALVASGLRV
jgi:hypothetical protein